MLEEQAQEQAQDFVFVLPCRLSTTKVLLRLFFFFGFFSFDSFFFGLQA
jgi:hypothetical protein